MLYRNTGRGTFANVTKEAGVGGGGWSVSAGFLDCDNDGQLDLFVSRYVEFDLANIVRCGSPFRTYCRPDHYKGTTNLLFRNEGSGCFREVSSSSGIATSVGKGMGVAFSDYDLDGFPAAARVAGDA